LRLKAVESFLVSIQCTYEQQQRGSAEKSGLRDVKRADFIRYWRRSGLKNPDKPRFTVLGFVRGNMKKALRTTGSILKNLKGSPSAD